MNKFELRNKILENIEMPTIQRKDFEASLFEIYPSEILIQTDKLQFAIDSISKNGGGRLLIPSGTYVTGALNLKSCVEIHLAESGTILKFINKDLENNYPLVHSHWEASPCMNYSPLLYGMNIHDVAITGQGTLDGGADFDNWWNWHHQVEKEWSEDKIDLQLDDKKLIREMNNEGIPVTDRVFGSEHYLRPNFIQVIGSERILLQDFKIINSPMWVINPVLCKSTIVDGIRIESQGPNNDGCDPESCNGVWIKNCVFDTGDDCISLKSGRDRDGRELNTPCENILIENNLFSDGHGGIALGSEMSGGIRYVLADNNRFTSPNLTYALRFKTNASRGGIVEHIMMTDTVIDYVSGAAVHGTMLYEDGRKGNNLPIFRNITIDNVTSYGGDYGIFLEAFPEVPIEGLALKNILIEGAEKALHSRNWKNPIIDNLMINGKSFPRPESVQISGIPRNGETVSLNVKYTIEKASLTYSWEVSTDGIRWSEFAKEQEVVIPLEGKYIRVSAFDISGNEETSINYSVLKELSGNNHYDRLKCRGMVNGIDLKRGKNNITRGELAKMLLPLANLKKMDCDASDTDEEIYGCIISNNFLPLDENRNFIPQMTVTRQEMASVAMLACGVSYKNASTTMPICEDIIKIKEKYGTNIDRALYFGFLELEEGLFHPERDLTVDEAIKTLNLVADFAGL